jgi:phosphotriesterase-related protein
VKSIQTVTGPVPADQLGVILPHEHLIVDTYDVRQSSEMVLLDRQMAIDEVNLYRIAGGTTIVDQTVYGLYPDPEGLRDISLKTGIKIVSGTGFYWQRYYPDWLIDMSVSEIAARFIEHITVGFPGTDIRAGIMGELGTHHRKISPTETKVLQAAAFAQNETGIPIATHAIFTEIGVDQLNILEKAGANLEQILIGHCDTNRNLDYSRKLLNRGVWIGYDAIGQFDKQTDERRAESIHTLINEGHLDRILLSTDIASRSRLVAHGGKGYGYLLDVFLPMLIRQGVTSDQISILTKTNPQKFLAGA